MAGQLFASTSERLCCHSIQSHKRLFEKIKCVTHRSPLSHLNGSQNRDEIAQQRPGEEETYKVLENVTPEEILPVCNEVEREVTK